MLASLRLAKRARGPYSLNTPLWGDVSPAQQGVLSRFLMESIKVRDAPNLNTIQGNGAVGQKSPTRMGGDFGD
jgi:hypothetical protein